MVLGCKTGIIDSQEKSEPIAWKYIMQRYNDTITAYESDSTYDILPYNNIILTGEQTINGVTVPKTLYCSDNLSGIYSYVVISGNPAGIQIQANEDFTIQGWFYPTLRANTFNSNGWNCLLQLGQDRARAILLRFGGTGYFSVNNSGVSFTSPSNFNWHFVTINRDRVNQKCRLYIDGVYINQINMPNSTLTPSIQSEAMIAVGTSANNVIEAFNGYVSEFYFIRGISLDGTLIVNPFRKVPPPS